MSQTTEKKVSSEKVDQKRVTSTKVWEEDIEAIDRKYPDLPTRTERIHQLVLGTKQTEDSRIEFDLLVKCPYVLHIANKPNTIMCVKKARGRAFDFCRICYTTGLWNNTNHGPQQEKSQNQELVFPSQAQKQAIAQDQRSYVEKCLDAVDLNGGVRNHVRGLTPEERFKAIHSGYPTHDFSNW